MKVAKDTAVPLHYAVKGPDDQVLDSSLDRETLIYRHGYGQIVPGLEKRLVGAEAGAQLLIHVPAAEAYGERHRELIFPTPKTQFDPSVELAPGTRVMTQGDHAPLVLTIVDVEENTVFLDANHPLAGMDVNFTMEIVSIRAATQEERARRHIRG